MQLCITSFAMSQLSFNTRKFKSLFNCYKISRSW